MQGNSILTHPVIGMDRTLYFGSHSNYLLYALNPNGTLKWKFNVGGRMLTPALGPDEIIYTADTDNNILYAIYPNGTKKWEKTMPGHIHSHISLGAEGTIYVACDNGFFYALNPDNTEKWKYPVGVNGYAIGLNGTIYICSDKLYAIGTKPASEPIFIIILVAIPLIAIFYFISRKRNKN